MTTANRGGHAPGIAALPAAQRASREVRAAMRAEGIAWARAWRERNRALFDALYPPADLCGGCGRALP